MGAELEEGSVELVHQISPVVVEPVTRLQGPGQVLAFEGALVGEEEDQLPLQVQVRTQSLQEGI